MASATFNLNNSDPRIIDLNVCSLKGDPKDVQGLIIGLIKEHIEAKGRILKVKTGTLKQVFYAGRILGDSHIVFNVSYPNQSPDIDGLYKTATYSVHVLVDGEPAPYFLAQVPEVTGNENQSLYAIKGRNSRDEGNSFSWGEGKNIVKAIWQMEENKEWEATGSCDVTVSYNLLEYIYMMAEAPGGLPLFSGPTDSGKSSSLTSMIDRMPRNMRKIEVADPVEICQD